MTYLPEEIKIENHAKIYADGACWFEVGGGVGGWGALIIENNEERQIYGGHNCTSKNKMEMMACIKALESLSQASIVKLYTDSHYIIDGITKWIHGWKKHGWITKDGHEVKNKALWEILDFHCNHHKINWQLIHSRTRENRIAYYLAEKGKEEEKEKIRKSLSVKNV